MAGPWEQYQQQQPAGPWQKYQQPDQQPTQTTQQSQQQSQQPPPSSGIRGVTEDFLHGVSTGVAGDIVGAGQVIGHALPDSLTDWVANSRLGRGLSREANRPTQGVAGTAGRFVGGAAPFVAMPATGFGTLADAAIGGAIGGGVQPTKSGSLASHGVGALAGGTLGAGLGALGGTAAQQAMRGLGVRIPPGRMIPLLGREWERFTSHLPVLNRMIGHGRQISLEDFNRVLYDDALEPLRGLNIPLATPAGRGSAGLDQLRNAITGRLNNVLSQSSLPAANVGSLRADLSTIETDAVKDMSSDTLRRLGAILKDDINDPIQYNGGMLPGSRLAGTNGVIATIGNRARTLWRSQDSQDRTLAAALDRIEGALLDHADIGAGGRAELDAARQSYARYKTLIRAGSGGKAEGYVDPDTLTAELRRGHEDLFARGGMRLQTLARQARQAGVPSTGEVHPLMSPWETGLGAAAAHFEPHAAAYAALPSLLYNRPAMSTLSAAANQAAGLGRMGGVGAGQAIPEITVTAPRYRPGQESQ